MNEPVDQVPKIKVTTLENKHMLVMWAPNSGWTIEIDKHERIAHGERIFFTVRRPDPAFLYPQAMISKRVLSVIDADIPIELYARVLGFDERVKEQGYGMVTPVEHFDDEHP